MAIQLVDTQSPYMKKIAQDNGDLNNNIRILLEDKIKKFSLNNIVELIVKN